MRVVFKYLSLVIVFVFVISYFSYQKAESVFADDWFTKAKNVFNNNIFNGVVHKNDNKIIRVYTWTDAQGVVHYDNHPARGNQTLIKVNTNVNVLPPLPPINMPENTNAKPDVKTVDEQLRTIQEAKKAHFDALTQ